MEEAEHAVLLDPLHTGCGRDLSKRVEGELEHGTVQRHSPNVLDTRGCGSCQGTIDWAGFRNDP